MSPVEPVPHSFGTHSGTFHADEVTACALMILAGRVQEDRIVRSREPQILSRCEYVADVGGVYNPRQKAFDHHQLDYQGDRASAGLILDYLQDQGDFSPALAEHLRRSLIWGVDAVDTGKFHPILGMCTFSQVIANFNPIAYEAAPEEQDRAFHQALEFTMGHVKRLMERFHESIAAQQAVKEAMAASKTALVFDRAVPWQDAFFELGGEQHPARFVIMPSGPHWKVRAIPPTANDRMGVRQPLPENWAGLLNDELAKVSGIPGAVFCHKGRFISVWETKEAAQAALNKTLEGTA
jgi:uncharacterized UPF0160 family protein